MCLKSWERRAIAQHVTNVAGRGSTFVPTTALESTILDRLRGGVDTLITSPLWLCGMEYHDAADFLTSLRRRRPKFGTETTARMLSHLGNPQDDVDFVQIAGSNGKGSTARMLESVLRTAGLDVGLFTSPSLNDFREQIRVNGRNVSKDRIAEYVERIDPCSR